MKKKKLSKKNTAKNMDIYKWLLSISKKDKIIPLRNQIDYFQESHVYRTAIFDRDNLICQICGTQCRRKKIYSKGEESLPIANCDHIYPVYKMIRDNNITQSIQALVCPEFWDLNNGRTLCELCHHKTLTYGRSLSKIL